MPDSHSPLESVLESAKAGLPGSHRRVRTSAAMLGLAISMGASGTFLGQTEGAAAAEQMAEPMLLAAALPPDTLTVSDAGSPSATYHTVQEGENLWQIAQAHRVDVQVIKSANGIFSDEVLKVGQVIRVPAESTVAPAASASVKTVAPVEEGAKLATSDKTTLAATSQETATSEKQWSESEIETQTIASVALPSEQAEKLETSQEMASTPLSGPSSNKASDLEAEVPESTAWLSRSVDSTATEPTTEAAESLVEQTSLTESVVAPAPSAVKRTQQLAALSQRLGESGALSQPVVPVAPLTEAYRVKPGDTIWTIASRHGIQSETLIEANGVQDPNLIVVGDLIQIPAEASVSSAGTRSSTDLASVPTVTSEVSTGSTQIARIRESSSESVDRAALYERIRQARQSLGEQRLAIKESPVADATDVATLPQSLPLNEVTQTAGQRDPHVTNLIAEIRAMQRQRTVAIAPSNPEQPTQIAAVTSLRNNQGSTVEAAPVNPEFAPEAAPQSKPTTPAPELLAAAPLSPEAYAPVMDVPTGRTVSPDLPVLPNADQYLPEAPNRFDGYIWPARGVLSSGYGPRWGRMHRGVDIAGPVGTPIFAAANGVVVRSGWNSGGYGNLVDIQHPDGSMTRYGHNSRLLVRAGQQVRQGQQIAEMGSTGYSTGPHLHFEIHIPGNGTVNPVAYLPSR
ncbi:MAG TPA: peptidoglycan DD-metalloendopeptidase family protein [Trichocoleus sp.]